MKKYCPLLAMLFAIVALFATVQVAIAQESPAPAGPSVNLVATVEARHGSNIPTITRDDAHFERHRQ